MNKIHAFDYMLTLFEQWHNEVASDGDKFENLSKLSVLKLLFLASVPKNNSDQKDLLNSFDKFFALPYGPVESDIYKAINSNDLINYLINERSISKKTLSIQIPLNEEEKNIIRIAVDNLKNTNKDLILEPPFSLVGITHQWESWKSAFNFAQLMEMQSYPMKTDAIRNDKSKFFGVTL